MMMGNKYRHFYYRAGWRQFGYYSQFGFLTIKVTHSPRILSRKWCLVKYAFYDGDMLKISIPVPHRGQFSAKWFQLWIDMHHPPAKIFNKETLSLRYLERLKYMARKHEIPLTRYNELMIMEKLDPPTKFVPRKA